MIKHFQDALISEGEEVAREMVQAVLAFIRQLGGKFKTAHDRDSVIHDIINLQFYDAALARLRLLGVMRRLPMELLHTLNRGLQLYPVLGVPLLERISAIMALLTPAVVTASRDEAKQAVHEIVIMLRFLMQREGQKAVESDPALATIIET